MASHEAAADHDGLRDLGAERFLAELTGEAATLAEVVRSHDLATPITTCPGWTLEDLAGHVGRGHRWATSLIVSRAVGPTPIADAADPDRPTEPEPLASWLETCAADLAAAVKEAGPATAVWTWSADRSAGFWLRRMTHDLLVHRCDAQLAVGDRPDVAADLAADGVSDLLQTFATVAAYDQHPFKALRGEGQSLHLHATDGLGPVGEWLLWRRPDTVHWEHGHAKADAAVRGTARDLLLVLNRRLPLAESGCEVLGDRALVEHWLAHSAF